METFRGSAASSSEVGGGDHPGGGSFEGGDGPPPPKKSKQQLREKSLRNKQGYATSKWARSEEKLQNVEWEVKKYEEREKDHAHLDKERDAKEAALAASEAKAKDRMQERGERYAASQQKNEDDRKLLKSKHQVEISAVRKEKESEIEKVKVKARVKVAASRKKADGRVKQSSRCSARAQKKEKVCLRQHRQSESALHRQINYDFSLVLHVRFAAE